MRAGWRRSISRWSAVIVIAGSLQVSASAPAQQASNDWLIVPGEKVGPITVDTSEEMLRTLFGPDKVMPTDVDIGEGFTEPGTSVYPGDPTKYLEIIWRDPGRTAVREVRLTGESSSWHSAEGISLGTTLKELERLNGFPFRLAGFAWDYGGTIFSCGHGRLRILGCADDGGGPESRSIVLRLRPNNEARRLPAYRQVLGEREFSSGHPAMQALNPSVYQMIVLFATFE